MADTLLKAFLISQKIEKYSKFMVLLLMALGLLTAVPASADTTSNVITPICNVYNAVHTAIFILGLTLMILGGALYAGSHLMPSQSKGPLQGYGMGMVLGGVIGVIIAVISPFLLKLIIPSSSLPSGISTVSGICGT